MKQYFNRAFRYVGWANQRVLGALDECPAAQGEALPLLAHMLAAEHVWLSRLERTEPVLAVWPVLTLAECGKLAAESESGWARFIEQLADDGAGAQVPYMNSQGERFRNTVADILTQVATHGAYHRGQIAKVLGRAGGNAISTDFIMFTRLEKQ